MLEKITYLESYQGLALVILIWRRPGCLPSNDGQLHMLNLEPDQQEIDPAHNHVLEVVLGFGVLELDMKAVFDAHVHLDGTVGLRRHAVRIHPEVLLADDVGHAPRDGHPHEVPQFHIDTVVGLVLLLDVLEVKWEGLWVKQLARCRKLLDQR